MDLATLRSAFSALADEIRGVPERLHRWTVDQHRPFDLMGDGSVAWCRPCGKPWPCDEFDRLTDEMASRS